MAQYNWADDNMDMAIYNFQAIIIVQTVLLKVEEWQSLMM
jgi:hypothetical protein